MPSTDTIYSSEEDGYIAVSGANWALIREASSGTHAHTSTSFPYAVRGSVSSGRGGTTYFITRSFFLFDTSGITHVPKSANLYIWGSTNGNSDMRLVKSTQGDNLADGDFDAIYGLDWSAVDASDGSGGGDISSFVTLYDTEAIFTWATGAIANTITLNQQALIDIAGLDTFKCALLDSPNDIRDITPTSATNYSGVFYTDGGSAKAPRIVVINQDDSIMFGANF